MALKIKESKNLDSDDHKDDDSFMQSMKQIMDENPRLYSKLAKL
jgi:hypothetical protein